MITLLTAAGSIIFALISVISWLWSKNKTLTSINAENAVKDQLSSIDAKIQGNQDQINAEKAALVEKEKNLSNEDIINGINSSNDPK